MNRSSGLVATTTLKRILNIDATFSTQHFCRYALWRNRVLVKRLNRLLPNMTSKMTSTITGSSPYIRTKIGIASMHIITYDTYYLYIARDEVV